MPKEKRKKDTFDVFGFNEGDSFPKTDLFSGGGSGYSISVNYDDKDKPVVKARPKATWMWASSAEISNSAIQEQELKA